MTTSVSQSSEELLSVRLGFAPDAKLVIISCDDLGASHAANVGVYRALREGAATCSSLMVPAPWARHAADEYRAGDDIGVHLTLNAENPLYRWGPLTYAPSLVSGEGGFPMAIDDLWEHADPEEVERELRTQIERALAWGIDVTHLTPHLSAITLRPEFFDVYIGLAVEFALPIRLPSTISAEQAGFPFRELAAQEGVWFPDHFDHDWRPGSRSRVWQAIDTLQAGVTEIHIQPVIDTPEVRAMSPHAGAWVDDLELALDPELTTRLAVAGAERIGFRAVRDAMRSA